jgi:hypothetical protein
VDEEELHHILTHLDGRFLHRTEPKLTHNTETIED